MMNGAEIIPFAGFAPDLNPATPGIFLDTDNLAPTAKGFEPFPSLVQAYPALPSAVFGGYLARYLDGSTRLIAGTGTKLYSGNNGVWTERGTGYGATVDKPWVFTMFGNTVIATNGVDVPQAAAGADAAFSALAGTPPTAALCEAVNNFVFLLNTSSFTNQWFCSGIGTATIWAADIAAQSNNDTVGETPGGFTCAKALGPNLVAYKLKSMFIARYIGPPLVWEFIMLSPDTGTWGPYSAVTFGGDSQFSVGWSDFFITNGGRPQRVESNLREFFFETSLDQNYAQRIITRWDRTRDLIVIHYPSRGSEGVIDKYLVWHPKTNRWTRGDLVIEHALLPELPFIPGLTYDGFGTRYTTWEDPGSVLYEDFSFRDIAAPSQALFLPDHVLYSQSGEPGASWFLTGDYGNDNLFSYLTRVKPQFGRYPADATQLTNYFRTNLGDTETTDQIRPLAYQGWFNLRRAARWHRFRYDFEGDYEIIGHQPLLARHGER